MIGRGPGLLVGLVLVATANPVGFAVGTPDGFVTIDAVTVEPARPEPGVPFTVTATIRAHPTSVPIELTGVELWLDGADDRLLDRAGDLGTIGPGTSLSIPLGASVDRSGTYRFEVRAVGWANGTFVEIRRPVFVRLSPPDRPAIGLDVHSLVAGVEGAANVTVANGLDRPITGVAIRLTGPGVVDTSAATSVPSIEAGRSVTRSVPLRVVGPGEHTVAVTVRYTTGDGRIRAFTVHGTVSADRLDPSVTLAAVPRPRSGTPAVAVTVRNRGNVPLEAVTLRTDPPLGAVGAVRLAAIEPGTERAVTINATGLPPERSVPVTISLRARAADRWISANRTLVLVSRPGRVVLTGLDVERAGSTVRLRGTAANVGDTTARGVVVRVLGRGDVRPAYPNRDYFVGAVPPSDFVPFDLTARVGPNATSVPVEIVSLVGDDRRRRAVRVPLDGPADSEADEPDASAEGTVPLAGALVALGVVGLVALAWRGSRAAG